MIVITLSKTPASLRGDLTKWCQEIQTGIYVGNVNAKVRACSKKYRSRRSYSRL